MPTRRIMILVGLTTVAANVAMHGLFRPWFARHASDTGIKGDAAQAGLLAS